MAETVAIDRPSVTKPVSRPRSTKPATVSASALARHLDCSRTYIGKLEAEGVIQRHGDGFPLDQQPRCLPAILAARAAAIAAPEADADHVKVKTEMLQLRLMEKRRELVRQADVNELVDGLSGVVLTHLSSLPARCAPRGDLATLHIERVAFEVMADKCGERAARCESSVVSKMTGGRSKFPGFDQASGVSR